jgi:hypothetical protein
MAWVKHRRWAEGQMQVYAIWEGMQDLQYQCAGFPTRFGRALTKGPVIIAK